MRFWTLTAFAFLCLTPLAAAQVRRPLPVIQRLEPTSGPVGSSVTVIGRNFHPSQRVMLGESELQVSTRLPNRWTVTIPEGAESGELRLQLARGTLPGRRFRITQSGPTPAISGISPNQGAPGSEIVIRGENFSPRLSENHVHLGETPVVVRNANPTELHIIVPDGAATGTFRVHVSGAGDASSDATFTVAAGTAVTSFAPAMGPPRTRVTLTGTGFHRMRARVRVYLGETRARVISSSETELTVEVPRRGAATGRWLVDVRGGGRAYSPTEYELRYPPEVSGLEPTFGAPGTRVTLNGAHFGTDIRRLAVRIEQTALTIRDISDERIIVEIPAGAETGHVEVVVEGLAPARTRQELRITQRSAVSGFDPRNGGPGTEVTIHGSGFSTEASQNSVMLSGLRCEIVSAAIDRLVVRIPEARSGPLVVAVENAGESRTRQPFVITRAPVIGEVTPSSGAAGAIVTIRGMNFGERQGRIEVRLGDRQAMIRSASATELRVVVPPGSETGRFRVTVRLQGTAIAPADFTVR